MVLRSAGLSPGRRGCIRLRRRAASINLGSIVREALSAFLAVLDRYSLDDLVKSQGGSTDVCGGAYRFPSTGLTGKFPDMIEDAPLAPRSLVSMELFIGLPEVALDAIASCARVRRLPQGVRIFSHGDDGVRAHAVIDGGVRIVQSGSDGAPVVFRFVGPGEMFGTVSMFTDARYPADAITLSETLEASWSEAELMGLIGHYPQIAINAIRVISKRLQELQERVRELATQGAERRIAHAVVRLARQAGHSTAGGTTIDFPLRRKDVAEVAGTTLHTASRVLTAWEKAGILKSHNQRLTVLNLPEILRIAETGTD